MQVAYVITYDLHPFEWHYLGLASTDASHAVNTVYRYTTGSIAEVSNKLCESVTKEVEK